MRCIITSSMGRELIIRTREGQTTTIPLNRERLAVGRATAAELCFSEDAGLSRMHCRFEPQGEDWTVQDLDSKNGTYLNDTPLKARTRLILKPGDRISAGNLEITFSPEGQAHKPVVRFDGADSNTPSTSTVVTSLNALERGGAKALEPIQALHRFSQELAKNRPLPELFP